MATPLIPLLGYGPGLPVPSLPVPLGEIVGPGAALMASLVIVLGLLLVVILLHREIGCALTRPRHGDR